MKIGDKVGIMSVECIEELLGGGQRLTLRCACGNVRLNTSARLRVHQPNSCGCLARKKVPKNRLLDRINTQGWSVHRAMTTPLKKPHAK